MIFQGLFRRDRRRGTEGIIGCYWSLGSPCIPHKKFATVGFWRSFSHMWWVWLLKQVDKQFSLFDRILSSHFYCSIRNVGHWPVEGAVNCQRWADEPQLKLIVISCLRHWWQSTSVEAFQLWRVWVGTLLPCVCHGVVSMAYFVLALSWGFSALCVDCFFVCTLTVEIFKIKLRLNRSTLGCDAFCVHTWILSKIWTCQKDPTTKIQQTPSGLWPPRGSDWGNINRFSRISSKRWWRWKGL